MRKVTDESLGTVHTHTHTHTHTSILLEKRNTKDSKKREEDKRNNLSSLSCHTYSFINISRNNDSDIVWRKWNNKDCTEGKR